MWTTGNEASWNPRRVVVALASGRPSAMRSAVFILCRSSADRPAMVCLRAAGRGCLFSLAVHARPPPGDPAPPPDPASDGDDPRTGDLARRARATAARPDPCAEDGRPCDARPEPPSRPVRRAVWSCCACVMPAATLAVAAAMPPETPAPSGSPANWGLWNDRSRFSKGPGMSDKKALSRKSGPKYLQVLTAWPPPRGCERSAGNHCVCARPHHHAPYESLLQRCHTL